MSILSAEKKKRVFLPETFQVNKWDEIQPFYEDLLNRDFKQLNDLKKWFKDRSELESVLSENMGWRYIKMTADTSNKELTDSFNFFVSEIQPRTAPYTNLLNEKVLSCPFLKELEKENGFEIVIKLLEKDHKIFRENNIPLQTEIAREEQVFGAISGEMTVEIEAKELTLQQASDYLKKYDRELREEAWKKIAARRYQDKDKLDALFNKLLELRNQVAKNADFRSFRDYMFVSLGRFSYTPKDCFDFHEAVKAEVVPILNLLAEERKEKLALTKLKPWDLSVNYFGNEPLKPFETEEDLLEKSIICFKKVDPFIGECIKTMKEMGHLDLVSRKGKAPGGYNYPLDETGVPFIFMNATSNLSDLVTLVHEGGHALHSFLMKGLPLNFFKHPPSEVAELASMSMELLTMDHWDIFFPDKKDLNRAKREHLENIISTLPWVATVDKFQHWIYENPSHTIEDRKNAWNKIYSDFSPEMTDWSGLEEYKSYIWQKQLHIYEVPFYYIEYGMAQLGAIGVWKNFKENPEEGLKKYMEALKLGYTEPIKKIYETAGVRFDFSAEYIKELMAFVKSELDNYTV